jgi:tyrosinase
MTPRIRRRVYSLADKGPELTWYRRAVCQLKSISLTTPGSWEFIGACHGIDKSVAAPPAAHGLWRECQHQTWFFLPWRRAYLAGFEAMIGAIVEELGGPAEGTPPY